MLCLIDTCQNKVSADQYFLEFSAGFLTGIPAIHPLLAGVFSVNNRPDALPDLFGVPTNENDTISIIFQLQADTLCIGVLSFD